MTDFLSIEVLVLIFTGICSAIFWKSREENDIYKTVFVIFLITSIINLLVLIPLTVYYFS